MVYLILQNNICVILYRTGDYIYENKHRQKTYQSWYYILPCSCLLNLLLLSLISWGSLSRKDQCHPCHCKSRYLWNYPCLFINSYCKHNRKKTVNSFIYKILGNEHQKEEMDAFPLCAYDRDYCNPFYLWFFFHIDSQSDLQH